MPNIPSINLDDALIFSRLRSSHLIKHRFFKSRNVGVALAHLYDSYYVLVRNHNSHKNFIHTKTKSESLAESAYIIAQYDIML